jgi:disease resistance protein RPS2
LSGESGKGVGICGRVPVDVKAAAYQAMHKKQNPIPPIDHTVPNVEAQRIEQEGRDLPDMAMEDWTESTRWEELMVIDEAGGSRGSQDILQTY